MTDETLHQRIMRLFKEMDDDPSVDNEVDIDRNILQYERMTGKTQHKLRKRLADLLTDTTRWQL